MPQETLAAIFLAFFLLVVFGWWYDRLVGRLEATSHDEGLTWLLVVVGVAVTLLVMGLTDLVVDLNAGVLGMICFAASGAPVTLGALRRHAQLRERYLTAMKELYGPRSSAPSGE